MGQCGVCVGGHTGRPEYEVYRLGDTDNPRDIRYVPLGADCDGNCEGPSECSNIPSFPVMYKVASIPIFCTISNGNKFRQGCIPVGCLPPAL